MREFNCYHTISIIFICLAVTDIAKAYFAL